MKCNICGKERFAWKARLESETDGNSYDVFKCKSCGLVFADPMPDLTLKKLQKIYNIDYTENQRQQPNPETERILIEATYKQLDIVEKYVKKGKALNIGAMDLGSRVMKESGWDVTVIEVSKYAAQTARELWGLNVINTRAEEAELPASSFDFIKLGHVIEHFGDPGFVVNKMASFLKPKGAILIETVNSSGFRTVLETRIRTLLGEKNARNMIRKLTGKDIKTRYGWLFPPIHNYTFSRKSFEILFNKAGLDAKFIKEPTAGDRVWFPFTPEQKDKMTAASKAIIAVSQIGSVFGKGDIIVGLGVKPDK